MRVVIIGAGGHATVVADMLLAMRAAGEEVEPIALVDDAPGLRGGRVLGLPVIGSEGIEEARAEGFIVAIGDNGRRRAVTIRLLERGACLVTARHPSALVGRDVVIGAGSMLCAGAIVNVGTVIGRGVIVNTGATVDHHNRVGDFAHVAPGAHTGGNVEIGDDCLVGIGATIMPGRRVGDGARIGAGAVVVSDVADAATVTGIPAKSHE